MKNKGFTLIELLAVIVILLVVSIITISVIGSVIEISRENAFKDSVLSAFNAVEYYVVENELGDVPEEGIEVKSLKLKNNTFVSGRITKNEVNQLIAEFVSNGEYCAVGVMDHLTVSKGECEITTPIIEVTVEGKNANIKVTDEYGIIGYMITESIEEPSEWEEIEKVASIEEIKTAEQAGTYYIHVKNKYGKTSVKEYVIEQSEFTSIITYIIGGTSIVREVTNGELVSDYVPTVSGRTFIGWTTNENSTTSEIIYATGDMTIYGISSVSKTVSSSALNWSNMNVTFSGNWPNNSIIYGYVSGYHNDEEGAGHLRLYCDGVELAGRDISAGQSQSASGSLNLGTKKSVSLSLSSNGDNTNIYGVASVSWTEIVTG